MQLPEWYLPCQLATNEAKNRGLSCEKVSAYARRLLINGHRCQIVKARYFRIRNGEAIPFYLPRNRWADFLVYVAMHTDNETDPSFFVVPRSKICRETGMMSRQHELYKYKNAWNILLTEPRPLRDSKKRIEQLNWKLKHVVSTVKFMGYQIEFIPRRSTRGGFIKNRIIINGKKCAVISAAPLSRKPDSPFRYVVNLLPPKDAWADFLIFIMKYDDEKKRTFIVPKLRVPKPTTAYVATPWFSAYMERWDLLAADSSNNKIDPDSTRQSPHSDPLQE